jgi:hypothetical protein
MEKGIQSAKVTGSESIALGSQTVDCWVVEADRTVDTMQENVRRLPTRIWVDKARSLVLRMISGSESGAGGKATKNTRTVQFTSASIEQGVAATVFQPQTPKKK